MKATLIGLLALLAATGARGDTLIGTNSFAGFEFGSTVSACGETELVRSNAVDVLRVSRREETGWKGGGKLSRFGLQFKDGRLCQISAKVDGLLTMALWFREMLGKPSDFTDDGIAWRKDGLLVVLFAEGDSNKGVLTVTPAPKK